MRVADNNKKVQFNKTIKALLIFAVLLLLFGVMCALNKTVDGSVITKPYRPTIDSTPLYVELEDKIPLSREYVPSKNMRISGVEVLLVGSDEAKDNSLLKMSIIDVTNNEEVETVEIPVEEVPVGDWYTIPSDVTLNEGNSYSIRFSAIDCNLSFMQVQGFDFDISIGFDIVTNDRVTLGDIFIYSRAIAIAIATVTIMIILFGKIRLAKAIKRLDLPGWIAGFGCEFFLVLLFIALSLNIYITSYVGGVYITSDSDGYLREAVNLVAGNGFLYDKIAGYDSWFANWPIIYPALIAGTMIVTGTNAYLASKIVAIITIAIIEIILYLTYRKDSWIYAIVLTNAGFLGMCYNTWSEIPFVLFLVLFSFFLGQIISRENASIWSYVGLTLAGTGAFLTRYFGIFVWFVAGMYWLAFAYVEFAHFKNLDMKLSVFVKAECKRCKTLVGLALSAVVSGLISVAYLVMNKIMNGNPTGVSRGTWWDDYQTLTGDLLDALIVEIFNVFSLDVPGKAMDIADDLKVWIVLTVSVLIAIFVARYVKRLSRESVFVVMAVVYYGTFICIRYRSSMDTFYFRFFAPATVLLCIGLIEPVVRLFKRLSCEHSAFIRLGRLFALVLTLLCVGSISNSTSKLKEAENKSFYNTTTATWDVAYSEIPLKSVVIWSDLDYRSTWYRPDVIGGELYMDDTYDSLRDRYNSSKAIVIKREDAIVIASETDYDKTLRDAIKDAIDMSQESDKYVILN